MCAYIRTPSGGAAAPQLAGTTYGVPSDIRKIHIFPEVYFLRPEISPFLHLSRTGVFNRIEVRDPWFRQFEQPEHSYTFKLTAAVNATNTSCTVDSTAAIKVGDRFMPLDGSGQVFRVTSVASATKLVIAKYTATGTATATNGTVATNTYCQLLGNTSKEGSRLPEIVQPQPSGRDNYVETMRFPFGGSRIRLTADMWVTRGMPFLAKQEWMTAKKAIEWKMKWQVPSEQVDGDTVYRTMGGLFYWITQQNGYVHDYTGSSFTKTTFIDDVMSLFDYGSDTKIAFCNQKVLSAFDTWKDSKLVISPPEEIFNLKVRSFETTSGGTLMLIHDKSLQMPNTFGAGTMNGMMFVVDPENIDYVTYQGNDLHVEVDKQLPDYDGRINEYIGDISIRVNVSQSHGVLYGINTIA